MTLKLKVSKRVNAAMPTITMEEVDKEVQNAIAALGELGDSPPKAVSKVVNGLKGLHTNLTSEKPASSNDVVNLIVKCLGEIQNALKADTSSPPLQNARHCLVCAMAISYLINAKENDGAVDLQ